MFLRSLYGQLVLVLFVLVATLLTQLMLSRNYLSTLAQNQELISEYSDKVGLVIKLERDVIDLQRKLLTYNETSTKSTIQQFNSAMERVEEKLAQLSKKLNSSNINIQEFSRMEGHLKDYRENFTGVVKGRSDQHELTQTITGKLLSIIDENARYYAKTPNTWLQIKVHIYSMDRIVYEYLNSPDSEHIKHFKQDLSALKKLMKSAKHKGLISELNTLGRQFTRLTQVTRGYIFLLKVVMAGSANEFLYIAQKIKDETINIQKQQANKAHETSLSIQQNNNVIAVCSILIVILIAFFLSKKVINPINSITRVFRVLARGEEANEILNVDRKDEIGDLARAAKIFHEKNQQTHYLLEQSQDMIARQEVMNIRLEEEKEKAENAAKSKSMFLANMSHEIRTPMNGIVGLVDLVKKTKLDQDQKNYLDKIAYSGQIMMNVINDILDFSKIEAGKLEIESAEYDIESVVENLISSVLVRVNEKSLNFNVSVSPSVPKFIEGDPLRVSQILLNLCNNSIKFTETGSINVSFDYDVQSSMLLMSVEDTGIGMNAEQIDKIFNSFTQADGSTSRKYGGTGLGLSIVKQLIVLMDGEINVESQPGKGTQVHLSIKSKSLTNATLLGMHTLHDKSLNYLSDASLQKAHDTLSNLDLQTIQAANDQSHDLKMQGPLLIECNTVGFIKEHKELIQKKLEQDGEVGFMVASWNLEVQQYICKNWKAPLLSVPFSPNTAIAFLSELYGLKYDELSDDTQDQGELSPLHGHVLLVEDNQINQLVAGDMLESIGLTFDVADDGLQALSVIEHNADSYDMVFMDVQMPNMDGYAATQAIRKLGLNDLIICGLSANALKEDLERAEQAGMSDYLTKPLILDKLHAMAKKYLS